MRDADVSSYGIKIRGTPIFNFRYAYDTALIERSQEAIKQITKRVNEVRKKKSISEAQCKENKGPGCLKDRDKRRMQHHD